MEAVYPESAGESARSFSGEGKAATIAAEV
jgi:hypothetical protein